MNLLLALLLLCPAATELVERSPQALDTSVSSTEGLLAVAFDRDDAVVGEAHRILEPGGLLCLSSLSTGSGAASRLTARLWSLVHRLSPSLVGGCRPLDIADHLPTKGWKIRHHARVAPFAIPSEVVVAERV